MELGVRCKNFKIHKHSDSPRSLIYHFGSLCEIENQYRITHIVIEAPLKSSASEPLKLKAIAISDQEFYPVIFDFMKLDDDDSSYDFIGVQLDPFYNQFRYYRYNPLGVLDNIIVGK